MEIIIGREEGARRLHCVADGRQFNVGQAGSVPTSVSRQHCKLTINGDQLTLENLKVQNVTFVDDNQIFSKAITVTNKVQLGNEKYTIPLQQIIQLATGKSFGTPGTPGTQVKTFSLRSLEAVWTEYDERKMAIQEAAANRANHQRIQGIISMCGMAFGLLPIPIIFRGLCVAAALCLAIYFFLSGQSQDSVQRQIHDLDEEFAKKYKCPNPECGRPFGAIPYRTIKFNKQCLSCGCKYTN